MERGEAQKLTGEKEELLKKAAPLLTDWFRKNGRSLPWRGTRDPYAIWLSEIMLQQTRTETVCGYYARFLERFPDSIFYLITPTAMTESVLGKLKISPERFKNFHDMLIDFAKERQCYIIDFYSLVLNDKGYLPGKYDCGDGVHPNYNGLKLLENEIRTHTVERKITFTFKKRQ